MPTARLPVTITGVSSSTGPVPSARAAAHAPGDPPTVTTAVAPDPHLAARVRRILDGAGADRADDDPAHRALAAALDRHDAPPDLRIRGPVGSGRHALARTLHARRGWRFSVDDIDHVAVDPDPSPAPDVEVVLLCTAPCSHELRWIDRPRLHPMVVVVTAEPGDPAVVDPVDPVDPSGSTAPSDNRPHWAAGRPVVDVDDADHPGTDRLIDLVLRATARVPALRAHRLAAELEALAADPVIGEVAETALCGRVEVGSRWGRDER